MSKVLRRPWLKPALLRFPAQSLPSSSLQQVVDVTSLSLQLPPLVPQRDEMLSDNMPPITQTHPTAVWSPAPIL
eukprot:646650-Hanusia_phi.AAC.1